MGTAADTGKEDFYSIDLPLSLYFDTTEKVKVKDIAFSLNSLEVLAKRLPLMLSELSGVDIEDFELSVSKIETGSLIETLGLMVFLSTPEQQEQLRAFITGPNMTNKVAKYSLLGMLLLLLASEAYTKVTEFTKDKSPSIQANNNVIINIGSSDMGITPERLKSVIEVASSDNRKELAKASMGLLKPIENHAGASLYAGVKGSEISIPDKAIDEVPFDADLNAYEHDISYSNVLLQVRALDRDNLSSGWKGVVPSIVPEKRLKIYFDDDVQPDPFYINPEMNVDVVVTYKNDINTGVLKPKHFTITRVYKK